MWVVKYFIDCKLPYPDVLFLGYWIGYLENGLKTVIFLLQMGFTSDFVPECPFKLWFWQFNL